MAYWADWKENAIRNQNAWFAKKEKLRLLNMIKVRNPPAPLKPYVEKTSFKELRENVDTVHDGGHTRKR